MFPVNKAAKINAKGRGKLFAKLTSRLNWAWDNKLTIHNMNGIQMRIFLWRGSLEKKLGMAKNTTW